MTIYNCLALSKILEFYLPKPNSLTDFHKAPKI